MDAGESNGKGAPSNTPEVGAPSDLPEVGDLSYRPEVGEPVLGYGFWPINPPCTIRNSCPHGLLKMHIHYEIQDKPRGLNQMLAVKDSPSNKLISKVPTLIIGLDVISPGSLWNPDSPPIAVVVHSRKWSQISEYRAYAQTLPLKEEMVYPLFYPVPESDGTKKDSGIMWELLQDFYTSSGNQKPQQIILFRYGVTESQIDKVLNDEVEQIKEACNWFDKEWSLKFAVIKLFEIEDPWNGRSGTISDVKWEINDFYKVAEEICSTRPSHYRVVSDDVGLSGGDLQHLVDSLSYVHLLRTYPISLVAPHWLGIKSAQSEERPRTNFEPAKVDLKRDREFIERGGEEVALYVLGQLNEMKDGKHYEFEQYLYDQYGEFRADPSESCKKWQHVSMYAAESERGNVSRKIIFAELCYSDSEGKYVSVKHCVLDPNDPFGKAGFRYGCGMCFASCAGPHITPHPRDNSRFEAGHCTFPTFRGPLKPDSNLKHEFKAYSGEAGLD